jgi:hypothetical protein
VRAAELNTKDKKNWKSATSGDGVNTDTSRAAGQPFRSVPFVSFVLFVTFVVQSGLSSPASGDDEKPKPEWRMTEPMAVVRGQSAMIRVLGQDLAPREIRFDRAGIKARIIKTEALSPKSDEEKAHGNTAVEVEVTPLADMAPGCYSFKLVHDGKESPTGRLYIDVALPEVEEAEPNDSLRQPQVLPAGSLVVRGKLDKEGVDVFQIQGKEGETWRFEVVAHRVGSPFEPVLRLRDSHLTPLRVAVDEGDDCVLEYRPPADGPYLLELFDGDNRSRGDFVYRLRILAPAPATPQSSPSIAR